MSFIQQSLHLTAPVSPNSVERAGNLVHHLLFAGKAWYGRVGYAEAGVFDSLQQKGKFLQFGNIYYYGFQEGVELKGFNVGDCVEVSIKPETEKLVFKKVKFDVVKFDLGGLITAIEAVKHEYEVDRLLKTWYWRRDRKNNFVIYWANDRIAVVDMSSDALFPPEEIKGVSSFYVIFGALKQERETYSKGEWVIMEPHMLHYPPRATARTLLVVCLPPR